MTGTALRGTGLGTTDVWMLARAADDAGYSSIWIPEVGTRDAITQAALAGHHTKKATVGTGVVPVFSRNPVSLALAAATAADATGGRFALGMGAGHSYTTEAWYDERWREPRLRLKETVEVVRRLLAGERVSHNGTFHIADFHLTPTPPPVPIYLAALTPGSLRLAGQIADGVILNWLPPEGLERASLLVREAAADAGRAVRILGYVRVAVASDDELHDAATAMREHTYLYVNLPAYANSLRHVGLGDAVEALADGGENALDALVDVLCACGDAGGVRSKLTDFAKAGVDDIVVYPVPFGDDPVASVLRTLRAVAP